MKPTKILFLTLIMMTINAYGDDLTWTGAAGDNLWDNPANWDGGKVPGPQDNVTVPNGTPECKYSNIIVDNLINEGVLKPENSFNYFEANGSFSNYGTIGTSDYSLKINTRGNCYNYGSIQGANVTISGMKVSNFASGTISSKYCTGHEFALSIFGFYEIINHGSIVSTPGGEFDYGGSIRFMGSYISNSGNIAAGDGLDHGVGGNVSIISDYLWNRGSIASGNNGIYAGKAEDGKVTIESKKVRNEGIIKGGKSDESKRIAFSDSKLSKDQIIMGDISIYADSIILQLDTNFVEGRIISFYCHHLEISDIIYVGGIWCTEGVHAYTTGNGSVDLSGIDQFMAIISEYGSDNHIYSNNITEPQQGLDYIFSPTPIIHPADETITGAYIGYFSMFGGSGTSDTLHIRMQNQSMLPKILDYEISSDLGWVAAISGSTPEILPFEFELLPLEYSIPEGTTISVTDTVRMIVYINDDFSDTSYCNIECSGDNTVGVDQGYFISNGFGLRQNYPNPFIENTRIPFSLGQNAHITISIINLQGQLIKILSDANFQKGLHEIEWDASDLPAGIYICKMNISNSSITRKLIHKTL